MTAKDAKTEMMEAREAAIAALDTKIGNMSEWKIFRSIDRAIHALEPKSKAIPLTRVQYRPRIRLTGSPPSYMSLADKALTETGKPMTTGAIVDYIGRHRVLTGDKAKIVIQSSLSKDDRFKSIPWAGGRAWWYADKPVPKNETAGG